MNYPHRCDGILTIEFKQPIKLVLDKLQADELTTFIAKDLHALFGIQNQTALVVCGAAFTSEQLLQPKFPVQLNINQYASAAFQGELNSDQVLSIGSNQGQMPEGLQPNGTAHGLMHLPFCLYTHDPELAEKFEAQLMHKGMISPPTYEKLMSCTDTPINHANYMTYLDLVAMMHNHYQQLGLSQLWEVIETALVNPEPKAAVISPTNNHYYLVDHLLFTPCFSWRQYSHYFSTKDINNYIQWLMAQRLSISAFTSHGLEIKAFKATDWPIASDKVCLGQFEQQNIKKSFWTEQLDQPQDHPNHTVLYQHPQAGIVAVTEPLPYDKIAVHYPLTATGISDIKNNLQHTAPAQVVELTEHSNWLL